MPLSLAVALGKRARAERRVPRRRVGRGLRTKRLWGPGRARLRRVAGAQAAAAPAVHIDRKF
eukprot:2284422-Prymnesium_polylepis.1